jgi:hypothetical protein
MCSVFSRGEKLKAVNDTDTSIGTPLRLKFKPSFSIDYDILDSDISPHTVRELILENTVSRVFDLRKGEGSSFLV